MSLLDASDDKPAPQRREDRDTRRRGVTMLELIVVTVLAGSILPALTATLLSTSKRTDADIRRETAAILAEEGVELLLAGGFFHWYPIARNDANDGRTSAPSGPPYFIAAGKSDTVGQTYPYTRETAVTLQVHNLGTEGTDDPDPFAPFVGNAWQDTDIEPPVTWTEAPPVKVRPWSDFRRVYTLYFPAAESGGTPPRLLECTVRVMYGPGDDDVLVVPLYIGNHQDENTIPRGLYWLKTNTQVNNLNSSITFEPGTRKAWGRRNATDALLDSSLGKQIVTTFNYPGP